MTQTDLGDLVDNLSMSCIAELFARTRNEESDRGAVLVLTALVMMLLLIIAAFATDLGAWYRQGQEQQRAADVGALNGVQAYDRGVKEYFAANGYNNWNEVITPQAQQEAELAGLQEAAETIIGLLEAGGLTFSNPGVGSPAADPTDTSSTSTYTLVADDGTEVVITRSWVVTGQDAGGVDVWGRSISVEVIAPGDQYFSNIVRDAPQISRAASSVLSNCDSDCGEDIELNPPLRGFNAAGSGDGYRPLVDIDEERVWLMNHLFDSSEWTDIIPSLGWQQIVCMDARAEAQCNDWAPLDKEFYGFVIPTEAIDLDRDRLYYGGMGQAVAQNGQGRRTGTCSGGRFNNYLQNCDFFVACVDTTPAGRGHCPPTKIADNFKGGGPWLINDKLWAVSAEGRMFCIDPDKISQNTNGNGISVNPWCAGYNANGTATVATGHVGTLAPSHWRSLIIGDVIEDSAGRELLIMYHGFRNKFHCWDTVRNQNCAGFGLVDGGTDYPAYQTNSGQRYYRYASRFFRYDTNQNVIGWCLSRSDQQVSVGALRHTCIDANGTKTSNPVAGVQNTQVDARVWTQYFTWNGPNGESKMYYSNYRAVYTGSADTGLIACHDWTTGLPCATGSVDAGSSIDFYAFSEFTPACYVGVGDTSKFYSFSAETGGPCSSSQVKQTIGPCPCGSPQRPRTSRNR